MERVLGWQQEQPNHCKEKVMQHIIALSAQLPSSNISFAVVFLQPLHQKMLMVHVFGNVFVLGPVRLGAEIKRLEVFYTPPEWTMLV